MGSSGVFNTTDPVPQSPMVRRIWAKIKNPWSIKPKDSSKLNLQSRLSEIKFANLDWLRRHLPNEPSLAQRGDPHYDESVENEVKASLKTVPVQSEADREKLARQRRRAIVVHEQMTMPGQESLRSRFKERVVRYGQTFRGLRSKVRSDQKALSAKPKPPEDLPPPEALKGTGAGHTPPRDHTTEGVELPKELWDRERAESPGVRRVSNTARTSSKGMVYTRERLSKVSRFRRDARSIHDAMIAGGVIPKGSPFDDSAVTQARDRGQNFRDRLARKLTDLNKDVIRPLRASQREAGVSPNPPSKLKWRNGKLFVESETRAPGMIRIGNADIHSRALAGLHTNLNTRIDARIASHKTQAETIHNQIRTGVHNSLSKIFTGPNLKDEVDRTMGNMFSPESTTRPNPEQVRDLIQHTGLSQNQIHNMHRQYRYHSKKAYTDLGRKEIHKDVFHSVLKNTPFHVEEEAKPAYTALKKLGKRSAIGAGIAAAGIGAGYLIHRHRQRELESRCREIHFAYKPKPWPAARKITADMMYRRTGGASTSNTPSQKMEQMRIDAARHRWDANQEKFHGTEYGSPLPRVRKLSLWEAAYSRGQHEAADVLEQEVKRSKKKAGHAAAFRIAAAERAAGRAVGEARAKASSAEQSASSARKIIPYVGAGAATAGVGTGYYVGHRKNGERMHKFSIPLAQKLKGFRLTKVGKKEAIVGGALAGGITAADAVTSAVNPDPDKNRKQSAYAGAKRGIVYGTTLVGAELGLRRALTKKPAPLFKFSSKDDNMPRDIAIGGIEGAAGYYTTDRLIRKINPKTTGGRLLTAGLVGGGATGAIGYGLNRFLRSFKEKNKDRRFRSAMKEIRFARGDQLLKRWHGMTMPRELGDETRFSYNPPTNEGYGAPYNPRKRLTVAQDRYRKNIRENEIYRKESNLAKSAVAGAALGAALKGRKGAVVGATAGLAAQTGLLLRGRQHRDQYGEENISSKRIERIPYQAAGLGLGAIYAPKAFRAIKKARKFLLSSRSPLIQFQNWETVDTGIGETPWQDRELKRWLKHPKSRIEATRKWLQRGKRIKRDLALPRDQHGNIIDDKGRTREAEWKKPWLGTAAVTTGALGLALLARKGSQYINKKAVVAASKLGHEPRLEPTIGERLSLNINRGAIGDYAKASFPKTSKTAGQATGLIGEMKQLKNRILGKVNNKLEEKVGRIESAKVKWNKSKEEYEISAENPTRAKRLAEELHTEADRRRKQSEAATRKAREVLKATKARGSFEDMATGKLSSKLKLIKFQADDQGVSVPGYYRGHTWVRAHPRGARRTHKQLGKKGKDYREGAYTGGIIGGVIGGTGLGYGWHASRAKADKAKLDAYVANEIAKAEAAEAASVAERTAASKAVISVAKKFKK